MTSTNFNALLAVVGRVLMASVFLPAGYVKVINAETIANYMYAAGLPASPLLAVAVGFFEIAAGVLLILGFKLRWTALALAAFTLLASLLFHNFWSAPIDQQLTQQLLFFKNLGLIGGLAVAAAAGGGAWSLDARRRPSIGAAGAATGG